MILLIMGLFTWGYLRLRAWNMERRIAAALAAGTVDPESEQSARHYAQAGLLNTKSLSWPATLSSLLAAAARRATRSGGMGGGRSQYLSVPFALDRRRRRDLTDFAASTRPCSCAEPAASGRSTRRRRRRNMDLKQGAVRAGG